MDKPLTQKEIKTIEQALEAVKNFGDALRDVPEELKTAEVCLEAVRNSIQYGILTSGNALEFVPEALKTAELCAEAVKNNYSAIRFVPKDLMTAELCSVAIKQRGYAIQEIPEEFLTQELCIEAVKNYGYALKSVPEEFRTLDMCIEAVKQEDWIFMLVPEKLKEQVTKATGVQQGGTNFLLYKHESDFLDKDKREVFRKEVERTVIGLSELCETARREGILALENFIDKEKLSEKAFLETGLQMAVDGTKSETIEEYLNSWIEANCNNSVSYYEKILASIIKTGVLCVQGGYNPEVAEYKMTVLIPRELIPDSLLPEKEGYFRQKNLEAIMQDIHNAYKRISSGLELFCYLEVKLNGGSVGESINYDDEIGEINKKIANTTEIVDMDRLHKTVPIKTRTTNSIKLWTNTLDTNVFSANLAIFDLIQEDKWTKDIPLEYKKAYKELIKLVSWFYNIIIEFKAGYSSIIPKTKDIFGKQLHKKATLRLPATDICPYGWITDEQFNSGMKSCELKLPTDNEQIKADLRKIWKEGVDIIENFGIELTALMLRIETNKDDIEGIGEAVKGVATLADSMETVAKNYETKFEEAKSAGVELKDCLTEDGFRIDSDIMLESAGMIGANIGKIADLQENKSKMLKLEEHITELVGVINKISKSIERFIDLTIKGDKAEKMKKYLGGELEDVSAKDLENAIFDLENLGKEFKEAWK